MLFRSNNNNTRKRVCVISNYILHKSPRKMNFETWMEEYDKHIINLYNIFIETLQSRYADKIRQTEETFEKFARMIFNKSSKYIPRY